MGKALITACVLLTACHGMYTAPADPLKNPPRIKQPKDSVAEKEPAPSYIEDCDVNFSGKPTKLRHSPAAQKLVTSGNTSLETAGASTPSTQGEVRATTDAIALYRQALQQDPYNAEATLKLALAYDRMLRKGCAIAMLRRLASLADSQNPSLESEARPNVELVRANAHWFRGYRIAAEKAAGL